MDSDAASIARQVFQLALQTIRGDVLVRRQIAITGDRLDIQGHPFDLAPFRRVWVFGAGKGSESMAHGLSQLLGDRVSGGLVVSKSGSSDGAEASHIEFLESGHPVPDQRSLHAGRKMLDLAGSLDEHDLVLFCISGGASALMEDLVEPLTLTDLQATNLALLASGWPIDRINAARKRISNIKNGGLGRAFTPARVVCLVLSDVLGDDLATIGSGPFVCSQVAPIGDLAANLPDSVLAILQDTGVGEPCPEVSHFILGNALTAAQAAREATRSLGLVASIEPKPFDYEAAVLGAVWGQRCFTLRPNECVIAWGESRVATGSIHGEGGRAQEAALAAAIEIEGRDGVAVLVAGTDGTDGPTEMAGAVVDGDSVERAAQAGVDAEECLRQHDSYRFHEAAGSHVFTGPTGTNLNELAILIRT